MDGYGLWRVHAVIISNWHSSALHLITLLIWIASLEQNLNFISRMSASMKTCEQAQILLSDPDLQANARGCRRSDKFSHDRLFTF